MSQPPTTPAIELLRAPAGPDRWADELVTLEIRPDGDLVLRTVAVGIAVERFEGDGRNKRIGWYTVRAGDVPRVRDALAGDLGSPVGEGRPLLEALRDAIGTAEPDEGEQIALRYVRWLSRHGIEEEFREEIGEAD